MLEIPLSGKGVVASLSSYLIRKRSLPLSSRVISYGAYKSGPIVTFDMPFTF